MYRRQMMQSGIDISVACDVLFMRKVRRIDEKVASGTCLTAITHMTDYII